MENNLVKTVKQAIAETQDGKVLNPTSKFSDFILSCIEANTKTQKRNVWVDTVELECDLNYMIHELKKAVIPLRKFNSH